jgi:hypothetical protein
VPLPCVAEADCPEQSFGLPVKTGSDRTAEQQKGETYRNRKEVIRISGGPESVGSDESICSTDPRFGE